MSSKENNEVAVEKIDNEKGLEGKCELKGTKRAAEVIKMFYFLISFIIMQILENPFGILFSNTQNRDILLTEAKEFLIFTNLDADICRTLYFIKRA